MSVQSEINRISGNVTAALAAIAEKGVTVDSGSTSDDLATLIAAIEAGSGEGGGDDGIYYEVVTFAETTYYYEMKHPFADFPRFLLYVVVEDSNFVKFDSRSLIAGYTGTKFVGSTAYISANGSYTISKDSYDSTLERFRARTFLGQTNPNAICPDANTVRFGATANYKFDAGDTFLFMAMR